jgi:hypothetical protein
MVFSQSPAPPTADNVASSRPEWIELSEQNKLPLHADVIKSTPWATDEEARNEALEMAAVRALDFAAESAPKLKHSWRVPTWLVADQMLREPIWVEEVDWDFGATLAPMHQAYVYLDLSPDKRDLLLGTWRQELMHRRMHQIGGGLGFVVVCLITLVTYLRLDDASRGYYSRWLGTAAAATVAGSAAALYTWIA